MFFIDIAVPRDVDPRMNGLEGIFVYDIDDLQSVTASHMAERTREAEHAESIVTAEVERFQQKLQTLDVVPAIVGTSAVRRGDSPGRNPARPLPVAVPDAGATGGGRCADARHDEQISPHAATGV